MGNKDIGINNTKRTAPEKSNSGNVIISGKYTSAVIFTTINNPIEDYSISQIQALCDNDASKGTKMCVMPDVHPGKAGTIGLTMTIGDKILPNVVGIDIGCGMTLAKIKGKVKEFQKLDTVIREHIPSGFSIRKKAHHYIDNFQFERLYCYKHINKEKAELSAGSLGSGNHFIELDCDSDNNTYLVIHSGSRHLGKEVTEYYLKGGQKELKSRGINIPYELTYLQGELKTQYMHDLLIVQEYAALSREIMMSEICKGMKFKILDSYSCIHNYIDSSSQIIEAFGAPMIRKGAISAKECENVIIPINMHDGIILGTGLGNKDWNYSAPHGSGRIMKREDVKNNFTLSSFKASMKGIYSTCINKDTLDEAPFAYRSIEDIKQAINDTVKIDKIIRPIYNFKGSVN